jgi:hypothetical protein
MLRFPSHRPSLRGELLQVAIVLVVLLVLAVVALLPNAAP